MDYKYEDEDGNIFTKSQKDMAMELDRNIRECIISLKFGIVSEGAEEAISKHFDKIRDKSSVNFNDIYDALKTDFSQLSELAESVYIGEKIMIDDNLFLNLGYKNQREWLDSLLITNPKEFKKYFVEN